MMSAGSEKQNAAQRRAFRFYALACLTLFAALMRLLPHPWNMTPITAIALFGGAHFEKKSTAFLVPLLAMLLSDIVLEILTGEGFYLLMPVVYGSFALIVLLGFSLRRRARALPLLGAILSSVLLFFLITNFGVWAISDFYPRTWDGLLLCYVAALPFLQNQLTGDLLYTALLFGGWQALAYAFPLLAREASLSHSPKS